MPRRVKGRSTILNQFRPNLWQPFHLKTESSELVAPEANEKTAAKKDLGNAALESMLSKNETRI